VGIDANSGKEHVMAVKRKVVAAGVAALAVGGTGAGIAATKLSHSPSEESQAVVNDAAKSLGVAPSRLSAALKKALEDRVDAAVADGRLTQAQGQELKQRIESGDFPIFGPPGGGPGFGFRHEAMRGLDAAASYLGLTEAQLRTQLESGKSLAQVAKSQNKSVGGLEQALVADAKTHLDQAVKEGHLTRAQADAMLSELEQHVSDLVNGQLPPRPEGFGFHRGFDREGPPAVPPAA
jgi:polyhydroxyalkanoate synthesis regulator phasin